MIEGVFDGFLLKNKGGEKRKASDAKALDAYIFDSTVRNEISDAARHSSGYHRSTRARGRRANIYHLSIRARGRY